MPAESSIVSRERAPYLRIVDGNGAVAATASETFAPTLSASRSLSAQPHVTALLLETTEAPHASAARLEEIILDDQALAARVLALANSAYFALPRKAMFVREAVVFLGFKTIRSLALAVNAEQLFQDAPLFLARERTKLWRHSLDVALASRKIAGRLHEMKRADVGSEEAFTAGLLHDVGKLVLESWNSDRARLAYRLIHERRARYADVESMLFPHGHCEAGRALAERWMLPLSFSETIACHHAPQGAASAAKLTAIVALANELTHAADHPGPEDANPDGTVAPVIVEALERIGLSPEELPALREICRAEAANGSALHDFL